MTFQWHLTSFCNLRCLHCYQETYTNDALGLDDNLKILATLNSFINTLEKKGNKINNHINFTGGEPFLYPNLFELIEHAVNKFNFSFAILSNGLLPSEDKLKKLKSLNPKFIQISLEGDKKENDNIRGQGSYDSIISTIKTYKSYKLPVILSFTANKQNYKSYSKVVKIAKKLNVNKIWTDRYLPNSPTDNLTLSTSDFFELNNSIQKNADTFSMPWVKTIVGANRALQFLESGGHPYKCSAGKSLLAIMPNGDILPCRRLPIKIGNILKDNIEDIYRNNPVLNKLRSKEVLDTDCKKCFYKDSCFGGLKCLSYSIFNDFSKKDPNCYLNK